MEKHNLPCTDLRWLAPKGSWGKVASGLEWHQQGRRDAPGCRNDMCQGHVESERAGWTEGAHSAGGSVPGILCLTGPCLMS